LALTNRVTPVGLSAILLQKSSGKDDRRVAAYASRSLSDVETCYSQTEKEALAIVWAIERLHLYLYGKRFILFTDCKPCSLAYFWKSKIRTTSVHWTLELTTSVLWFRDRTHGRKSQPFRFFSRYAYEQLGL
jgi:hypothetical protein